MTLTLTLILQKRVYDVAAWCGSSVTVTLDGEKVRVRI